MISTCMQLNADDPEKLKYIVLAAHGTSTVFFLEHEVADLSRNFAEVVTCGCSRVLRQRI